VRALTIEAEAEARTARLAGGLARQGHTGKIGS
jgi:hypothetical protein